MPRPSTARHTLAKKAFGSEGNGCCVWLVRHESVERHLSFWLRERRAPERLRRTLEGRAASVQEVLPKGRLVIGWTDPEGSRSHIGALLLSYYTKDGRPHYAGRAGTGMTAAELRRLAQVLRTAAGPPHAVGRTATTGQPFRLTDVSAAAEIVVGKRKGPATQAASTPRRKGRDADAQRAACAAWRQRRPADRASQRGARPPPAGGTTPAGRSNTRHPRSLQKNHQGLRSINPTATGNGHRSTAVPWGACGI